MLLYNAAQTIWGAFIEKKPHIAENVGSNNFAQA